MKRAKQIALTTARELRLLDAVADSRWRRSRLLILCYHSLSFDEEHLWRRPLFFTAEEFEARLKLLQKWRLNVLPLGEAVERLKAGTLPARSAALTFDDGSADFALLVWPLLKKYSFPGTVYATTYYSEKRRPLFRLMCAYLFWKGRTRVLEGREFGLEGQWDLATKEQRVAAEQAFVERADQDGLDVEGYDRRAAQLAAALGVDYDALRQRRVLQLMTPEEMKAVAADGADLQLHTHRHRVPRDQALFGREIIDNRTRLERASGRPAVHFCYPSGVYLPEFLPWLDSLGVKTATTTEAGLADRSSTPLLLPRVVDTASLSPVELEGWLSGASHFLPRRRTS